MDVVTDTANTVVRQSTQALQVAAGELAKQASAVAQLANVKDPIAWLTGEEDGFPNLEDGPLDEPPPALAPVPLAALRPWGSGWAGLAESASSWDCPERSASQQPPPFDADSELNGKVFLWEGDICSLEVDALLAPSAAGFAVGASTTFAKVLRHGGRDLCQDLHHLEACRSGEARITKAYGLPCSRLLLTVGPKYKEKYQTAAQNTLNACYRECLQLLVESELRTVAIPCTWYREGYPPEEQAHVALRTVRRSMEKLRLRLDAVVFVALSAPEAALYDRLLPLYFPRTSGEVEESRAILPESCYSEWGEVSVDERRIRVASCLMTREDDDDDRGDSAPLFSLNDDDDRTFLSAKSDADEAAMQRLEGTMIEAETPDLARQACIRYLRRARHVRTEPDNTRFVFRSGQDRFGRHTVVLLGARLPSLGVRDERTLPLFVKELELLRGERFVLLYANSNVPALDSSKFEVLQEMLMVIGAKYRDTLQQLLVLHPGLWFRAAFVVGRALNDLTASVWHDTIYLDGLADLAPFLQVDRLDLPGYVHACDAAG
mmetsp:Transcript_92157/g.269654  ORF Transcript_92157/g.269654 Transcript_92157/m.269654 type:complete len:548 (-) Transcript_92157:322-1965(-)